MIALYPVLRQRIKETGISWAELSAVAEISSFAFHLKMWGLRPWTLTDAVRICGFFRTPDAEHLFLRNYYKREFLENQGGNSNV